jgi:sulfoxide reductase heme-binding subunit YedZ
MTSAAIKSPEKLKITKTKTLVWIFLAVPFVLICVRFAGDSISYGQVIHQTGLWSAGLLVIALSITPVRNLWKSARWINSVARYRRAVGVASFAYAGLHTGVYLERKWGADLIVREGLELPLATGWLAFAVFFVLAITSNDTSVRALGRSWKKLHRYVYAATILVLAHWWLAAFDPTLAYVFVVVLLMMQLPRIHQFHKQKPRKSTGG